MPNLTAERGSSGRLRAQILLSSAIFAVAGLVSGCTGSPDAKVIPTITPGIAVLMAGQTAQFTANENGTPVANPIWKVNNVAGGASATGTISSSGVYTAPSAVPSSPVLVTAGDSAHSTESGPVQVVFFNPNRLNPGNVLSTNNVLVANYVMSAPEGSSVQVQFGTTTSYGLATWVQPTPRLAGTSAFWWRECVPLPSTTCKPRSHLPMEPPYTTAITRSRRERFRPAVAGSDRRANRWDDSSFRR